MQIVRLVAMVLAIAGIIYALEYLERGIAVWFWVGLLGFALCAWLAVSVLPPAFRWFVDLCRKPFHKNDGGVQQ